MKKIFLGIMCAGGFVGTMMNGRAAMDNHQLWPAILAGCFLAVTIGGAIAFARR